MLRSLVVLFFVLALAGAPAALVAQDLDAGGESRGTSDPNGGASATFTSSTPEVLSTTTCELNSCGEGRGMSDPDGLTAPPRPEAPLPAFLAWLRALFAV